MATDSDESNDKREIFGFSNDDDEMAPLLDESHVVRLKTLRGLNARRLDPKCGRAQEIAQNTFAHHHLSNVKLKIQLQLPRVMSMDSEGDQSPFVHKDANATKADQYYNAVHGQSTGMIDTQLNKGEKSI